MAALVGVLAGLVLALPEAHPAHAQPDTVVRVIPALGSAMVGGRATAAVWVDNPVSLGAFQFTLEYDAAVVSFEDVELGPLLGSTGRDVIELPLRQTANTVTYGAVSAPGGPGPSQSGELARVHFMAKGSGTSPFRLVDVRLADEENNPLDVEVEHGAVRVRGSIYLPTTVNR
jgi:hypothetical protein